MKSKEIDKIIIKLFFGFLILSGLFSFMFKSLDIAKSAYNTFNQSKTNNGIVKSAIQGVESGFSTNVFGQEAYINLYGITEKLLGRKYIRDIDSVNNIIKDNHGKLNFIAGKEDNSQAVAEISRINNILSENGINMLYVQTPIKYIKGYTKIDPSIIDYSNENSDKIVAELRSENIDVIDLRNLIEIENIDKEEMFYKTDHHWTIETSFWGVQKVVEKIKTNYSIDLDPTKFHTDVKNYNKTFYPKSFLGSQGRRVGKFYAGVDDFTLLKPNYETNFTVNIKRTNEDISKEGSFEDAILDELILEDSSIFTNRYAAYFGADYPEVKIKNNLNSDGKKILIVKDSFGIPFSAFMATMVDEVRMIDTRYYKEKTVDEYALDYKPDIVLYVYRSLSTIQ